MTYKICSQFPLFPDFHMILFSTESHSLAPALTTARIDLLSPSSNILIYLWSVSHIYNIGFTTARIFVCFVHYRIPHSWHTAGVQYNGWMTD